MAREVTLTIDDEIVDTILVAYLNDTMASLVKSLGERWAGEDKLGLFHNDVDRDIEEIKKHIDALRLVINYISVPVI